jgi:hypothetical protein
MRITKKFLQLTKRTYPYGTEHLLKNHLPTGYQTDNWGNYYLEVGSGSTTMFTCHLDTASYGGSNPVRHVFEGNFIKTDGSTILGADDKAGMVVLLYMIKKQIPGIYYFFLGEERGCIGSSDVSENWKSLEISKRVTKVVSFDRRGTGSIITEQFGGVCCSDEFAKELASRLNAVEVEFHFRPDPTGIYTDSAQFIDLVPECTNISVGYYNEHTGSEKQNIEFLRKLCQAVVKIDWESLPIKRDPSQKWSSDYYHYPVLNTKKQDVFYENDIDLRKENEYLERFLNLMGIKFDNFIWTGVSLYIVRGDDKEFIATRSEILDFVPELDRFV